MIARRRRWRVLRRAVLALLVVVGAWVAGFFWFVTLIPSQGTAEEADKTDALVVLTGGAGRLDEGLRLLGSGAGGKLFVSGVYRGNDVAALLRLARSAPQNLACCIVLGYTADNTAGNARETAAWVQAEGASSIRLITANYHLPRSMLEFRRSLPGTRILPHPVFPPQFKLGQWWRYPGTASLIAQEYNKYLLALVGIRLTEPGPPAPPIRIGTP